MHAGRARLNMAAVSSLDGHLEKLHVLSKDGELSKCPVLPTNALFFIIFMSGNTI